jgi:hypothetical protein
MRTLRSRLAGLRRKRIGRHPNKRADLYDNLRTLLRSVGKVHHNELGYPMKSFLRRVALVVGSFSFSCLLPEAATAWGRFGHLVVCDLAYRNLADPSKEALKKLFNVTRGGITVRGRDGSATRHHTSFNIGKPWQRPALDATSLRRSQCSKQSECRWTSSGSSPTTGSTACRRSRNCCLRR